MKMLLLNETLKVTYCLETWALECHSELELLMVLLGSINLSRMACLINLYDIGFYPCGILLCVGNNYDHVTRRYCIKTAKRRIT